MIVGLYAVQDAVAGVFHPPFQAQTPGTAERFVMDMVAQAGHPYNLHPGDYFLWAIGSYDDQMGLLIPAAEAGLGNGPQRLLCLDQFRS